MPKKKAPPAKKPKAPAKKSIKKKAAHKAPAGQKAKTKVKAQSKTKAAATKKRIPIKKSAPILKRASAAKRAPANKPQIMSFGAAATITCVDADTAVSAVTSCQVLVIGHQVPLDTKVGDVLQGDSIDRYRVCVSRNTGVPDVTCTTSMTFGQVADGITCP